MMTFVAILHILVAVLLIGLVLIQDSKGGGALGMGGGSNSVLGAAGAESLWAKLTRIVAAIFAVTCISLTYMTASTTKSVIESTPLAPPPPAATEPVAGAAKSPTTTETKTQETKTTETAPAAADAKQADAPKK